MTQKSVEWVFLTVLIVAVGAFIAGTYAGEAWTKDAAREEFELNYTGCRLWNALRPADEIGAQFYIGGWVTECDGVMGPLIEFGPEEAPEEVILRLENYIANFGYGWKPEPDHTQKEAP